MYFLRDSDERILHRQSRRQNLVILINYLLLDTAQFNKRKFTKALQQRTVYQIFKNPSFLVIFIPHLQFVFHTVVFYYHIDSLFSNP